jgi:hypothetical protein
MAGRKPVEMKMKPRVLPQPEEKKQDLREIISRQRLGITRTYGHRMGMGISWRAWRLRKDFVLTATWGTLRHHFSVILPGKAVRHVDRRSLKRGRPGGNMMAMAAGLAICGKDPDCHSFGMFSAGRAWEMIRQIFPIPVERQDHRQSRGRGLASMASAISRTRISGWWATWPTWSLWTFGRGVIRPAF